MLWRPPGVEEQDPARWDAHPERSRYFLEILANEKREGRLLQGNPNNSHYNLLIRSFYEKFKIYHTKPQFKNHFATKKQLWNLLCWAQNCTGISWDHDRKKIIASPEWWDANKERKGLLAVRDKAISDYDLLELVYRGQHAEGTYMHDPTVPRFPRPEGVGDSDPSDTALLSEPRGNASPDREAENRRRKNNTPSSQPGRKKKNMRTSDVDTFPVVDHWFDRMEEMRIRRQESKTLEKTLESVTKGSPAFTGSFKDAVNILVEMKLDGSSDLFLEASDMFDHSKHMRDVIFALPNEQRWPWLVKVLNRRKANVPPTPTKAPAPTSSDCGTP